jgi:ribosomal protein S6--L-glutamate ligase
MNSKLFSTKRLYEAARNRGHHVEIIPTTRCYMDIASKSPKLMYRQKNLNYFDAVIPRIGSSISFYGQAVVRQFEMMGIYSLNESVAIGRARDKLRSLQILSRKGILMPKTSFAHSTKMTQNLMQLVGGAPLVVKLLEGTQGRGVVLAETPQAAEALIDAFREMDANFLVQEFIKEAKGSDIRCFVVGDQVVASMQRKAREGEFRSNLHRGGRATPVEITADERQCAIDSAQALGLNLAGVDILRSTRGPCVIEVNSSPGLEGIETSTGVDVAGKIIEFVEQNARPNESEVRGKG